MNLDCLDFHTHYNSTIGKKQLLYKEVKKIGNIDYIVKLYKIGRLPK